MDTFYEEYIERNNMTLKLNVYYRLGGYNNFTSKVEKRGYFISVVPVELEESSDGKVVWEKQTAFTGTKQLLFEAKRKSNKSREKAMEMFELYKEELIEHVLAKNTHEEKGQ